MEVKVGIVMRRGQRKESVSAFNRQRKVNQKYQVTETLSVKSKCKCNIVDKVEPLGFIIV